MARLESEPIYMEAVNVPQFFIERAEDYRLVRPGEAVKPPVVLPGVHLDESITVTARPRRPEWRGDLLYPVGRLVGGWAPFFDGERPLFDIMRRLDDDEAIRAFAAKHGPLFGGVRLDLGKDEVLLESTGSWQQEIRDIDYAVGQWESGVGQRDLVTLLNEKLRDYPSSQEYGIDEEGTAFPTLRPSCLAAAAWLQLAQTIFLDGPNERLARRSYLTGLYYAAECMSKKRDGPCRGMYYHPIEKRNLYRQNSARKKAHAEGRALKPSKKKAMKFIVPFPADLERQANDQ
jgi:hypothetical protein